MVTHSEAVLCSEFDFYGKRLICGTADHKILIYDFNGNDWELTTQWKAHISPVYNCSLSHPYFGSILATCSNEVVIWEQIPNQRTPFVERCKITDARSTVDAVHFAPQSVGLKLATLCRDGFLRFYIPSELISLTEWTLIEEVQFNKTHIEFVKSSYSPDDDKIVVIFPNTVVVYGSVNNVMTKVYEASLPDKPISCAFSSTMGRSYDLVAVGTEEGRVYIYNLPHESKDVQDVATEMLNGKISEIEWNITGTELLTTTETEITKWQKNSDGKWHTIEKISYRENM
eukprot:NODE_88_length_21932_cov_0.317867.p9 type:complete len:286 gc:universal NODE_88_length_21932_cov_0.317867:3860-3003(-)